MLWKRCGAKTWTKQSNLLRPWGEGLDEAAWSASARDRRIGVALVSSVGEALAVRNDFVLVVCRVLPALVLLPDLVELPALLLLPDLVEGLRR